MEVRNYHIDCNKLNDAKTAHEYLREIFGFPEYYGNNLDALHDCLTERPKFNIVIEEPEALNDSGHRILNVIAAAAAENGGEIITGDSKHEGNIDNKFNNKADNEAE